MPDLGLTLPFGEPGKRSQFEPIHISRTDEFGRARSRWQCPHCLYKFVRRQPCADHMGLTADRKASCPVLIAEDDRRRMNRSFSHDGYQEMK